MENLDFKLGWLSSKKRELCISRNLLKSASRELVRDIPGDSGIWVHKNRIFCLWTIVALRSTGYCSGSMPMIYAVWDKKQCHAEAALPTLQDARNTCGRSWTGEVSPACVTDRPHRSGSDRSKSWWKCIQFLPMWAIMIIRNYKSGSQGRARWEDTDTSPVPVWCISGVRKSCKRRRSMFPRRIKHGYRFRTFPGGPVPYNCLRTKILFFCTQMPESRTSSLDALLRISLKSWVFAREQSEFDL